MARHQTYSKRSRESRKAMTDGTAGDDNVQDDYPGSRERMTQDCSPLADDLGLPPAPVS